MVLVLPSKDPEYMYVSPPAPVAHAYSRVAMSMPPLLLASLLIPLLSPYPPSPFPSPPRREAYDKVKKSVLAMQVEYSS